MVCSPDDAIDVFLRAGADALAIGPFYVERPANRVVDAPTLAAHAR
jgi:hypothetical protein